MAIAHAKGTIVIAHERVIQGERERQVLIPKAQQEGLQVYEEGGGKHSSESRQE